MKQANEHLKEALAFAGLDKLPRSRRKDFSRAIIYVEKLDGSRNYTVIRNEDSEFSVIKDFGNLSPINLIISVYPYQ